LVIGKLTVPLFPVVLAIQYLTFLCYFCTRDWTGDCLVFGYLTAQLHAARAMKALCGFKPRQTVSSPSLKALPLEAKEKVDRLAHELFAFGPNELTTPNASLFSFRDVLMAALLKDLTQHQDDVGLDDPFFERLLHAAGVVQVSLHQLKQWGVLIKDACSLQNSCNADAIGTAEEKQFREMTQSFSKLTEKVYKAEESTRLLQATVSTLQGTVHSFHETLAKVAANVETIAARAVVDSPGKVFPEQKRGLSEPTDSQAKKPRTEALGQTVTLLARDPGPPVIGKPAETTVVKLLFEFRTHGIDPLSTVKFTVKSMNSSDKTRCKKIWSYAKDNATMGEARTLVFVTRQMKFSSEIQEEQTAYVDWKNDILEACNSVVNDMIPSLQKWSLDNNETGIKDPSVSKLKVGPVVRIIESMDKTRKRKA
jgi:hypothetical protein